MSKFTVEDVVKTICRVCHEQSDRHRYPLSKARLTKLVYLVDWVSALQYGQQATPINWLYNHYGPYVTDVTSFITGNNDFHVLYDTTEEGSRSEITFANWRNYTPPPELIPMVNDVMDSTASLNFQGFLGLVYSTFPISSNPQYSQLNLVECAAKARESIRQNEAQQ